MFLATFRYKIVYIYYRYLVGNSTSYTMNILKILLILLNLAFSVVSK